MNSTFKTKKSVIGNGHPTYFIADIAANHDGSLEKAIELIHLSAENGANAAKFQNFSSETIVSDFGFKSLGEQKSHQAEWNKPVSQVYKDASIPLEWAPKLKVECDKANIDYFTSPYDTVILDYLADYVCAWKIGSGDITWHDAIAKMAQYNLPIFLASGASTLDEVKMAVKLISRFNKNLCLMQCNTNYTASIDNFNYIELNVLKTFKNEFDNIILGLSDHTPGHTTVLGAVALGATVIEKHFTDNVNRNGPDHKFSMDPIAWKEMVDKTKELEKSLGIGNKLVMDNEKETVILQRRAIRAKNKINKGQIIKKEDIICLRPCPSDALPPYRIDEVIDKVTLKDIDKEDIINLKSIE
jgi:sialic acid synthase SpsE